MRKPTIIFVWDNFGPGHVDRCEAVARRFAGTYAVVGIELAGRSHTYDWRSDVLTGFVKRTLFPSVSTSSVAMGRRTYRTLRACLAEGPGSVFLCNYEQPSTFIVACVLRILRRSVYVMDCSKFDDYPRYLWREVGKWLLHMPYRGALSSGVRCRDYKRFLGIRNDRIAVNYNALSIDRIRRLAGAPPAPWGIPHRERHFTIVARLVEKKNLFMALDAFAAYARLVATPRDLHFCGSGPLEAGLRDSVAALGLQDFVHFHGFVQSDEVCRILGATLALLLPSVEEQFGNVVIEAQSMGLPVILSDNCGARDLLVRTGVNGFVVEPDNPRGMALFMSMLSQDEDLWREMALATRDTVHIGDAQCFAEAVASLVEPGRTQAEAPPNVTAQVDHALERSGDRGPAGRGDGR